MKKLNYAIAACVSDLGGRIPTEIQLTLDGTFKAKDGRPAALSGWVVNNEIAQSVIQLASSQADAFVIDYEHQTLYAKQNGQPSPAAGWFKTIEYREGLGLFATDVEWTDAAALAIQNKEYRYISPVISYDNKTGAVTKVLMAALVNNPALDGMADLTALANDYFSQQNPQDLTMQKEIDALKAEIADLKKQLSDSKAACSTETVDLSQYVPIQDVKAIQTQLTALSAQLKAKEDAEIASDITATVEAALSDGRLLPGQKEWATKLGNSNLAALKEFVTTAKPIAALTGTQTGGIAPETVALSNVKTAQGWEVDTDQAALHQQIVSYQKEHNVDIQTAIVALGV